jgi:hypothetical protein
MKTGVAKAVGRAATCAALVAACAPAWLILMYGVDVPYSDQWNTARFFEKLTRGSLTFRDLFEQQSEYRQLFPHLIFVALGRLTRWDVRYEMLVSLLLAWVVALNIRRLGTLGEADPPRRAVLQLLASLLIFSAIQYENWLFGVQVVYFVPVACVTTGLLLAYHERVGTRAALVGCAALSVVATFSSANGVVCWAVLPPALLAARPGARAAARRWLPLWCTGLALCAAAYAYGYHTPAGHPRPSEFLSHPLDALGFFVALLGGPLAVGLSPLAVATLVGACALSAYVLACAYVFRFREDRALLGRAAVWAALGAYSLGTAAMVTAGRLGFGLSQSITTRYTTFTLYLLVALVYLLPCVIEDAARKGRLAAGLRALLGRLAWVTAVLLVLAHVTIFALVVRHGASNWRRALLRAKACLLFIEVATEERCLVEWLYPDTSVLRERAGALDRIGYLRPPLIRDGRVRGLSGAEGCSDDYGSFELLPGGDGLYAAAGDARLPLRGEPADAVVLAYGAGEEGQTVFALAEVGAVDLEGDAGWRKVFPRASLPAVPQGVLTAWVFDAESGKAYRLCGAHEVVDTK